MKDIKPKTLSIQKTVYPNRPKLARLPDLDPNTGKPAETENKSFIQKYWMYIVPILIILMFSGGSEEQQPEKK